MFPFTVTESQDTDGDLIGNNEDAGDDNDGIDDAEDSRPLSQRVPSEPMRFQCRISLIDTTTNGIKTALMLKPLR